MRKFSALSLIVPLLPRCCTIHHRSGRVLQTNRNSKMYHCPSAHAFLLQPCLLFHPSIGPLFHLFFFFFPRPVMVLNNSTVSCLYVSDMNFLFQHIHKANSSNRWRNIIDSLTFLLLDLVSYWHPASTCLSLLSYEFPNCDAKLGNWQSIRRWRMEGIESCNNPVQAWLLPWRFEFHKGLTSLLLALIKVIYAIFYGISSAACLNSVWGPVVPERCVCLYDKVGVDASLHQWGQRFITLGSLPESDFYSIAAFFSIPLLRQQAAVLSFKCINAPVICHLHQSHSLRKWK